MTRDHGPQIKDDELYEELRAKGASKRKAARIANAKAAGTLDHRGTRLDDRSRQDLIDEARTIGIKGRSRMTKVQLVDAIRNG